MHSPGILFLVGFLSCNEERSADFNICCSLSIVVVSVVVVEVDVVGFFFVVVDTVMLKFNDSFWGTTGRNFVGEEGEKFCRGIPEEDKKNSAVGAIFLTFVLNLLALYQSKKMGVLVE